MYWCTLGLAQIEAKKERNWSTLDRTDRQFTSCLQSLAPRPSLGLDLWGQIGKLFGWNEINLGALKSTLIDWNEASSENLRCYEFQRDLLEINWLIGWNEIREIVKEINSTESSFVVVSDASSKADTTNHWNRGRNSIFVDDKVRRKNCKGSKSQKTRE